MTFGFNGGADQSALEADKVAWAVALAKTFALGPSLNLDSPPMCRLGR